jgi:hypothetical protein
VNEESDSISRGPIAFANCTVLHHEVASELGESGITAWLTRWFNAGCVARFTNGENRAGLGETAYCPVAATQGMFS